MKNEQFLIRKYIILIVKVKSITYIAATQNITKRKIYLHVAM